MFWAVVFSSMILLWCDAWEFHITHYKFTSSSMLHTTCLCPITEIFPRDPWPLLPWVEKEKGIGFSRGRGSGLLSPEADCSAPLTFFFSSSWNQLYSKHLKILHMCRQLGFTTYSGWERPTDMHKRTHTNTARPDEHWMNMHSFKHTDAHIRMHI